LPDHIDPVSGTGSIDCASHLRQIVECLCDIAADPVPNITVLIDPIDGEGHRVREALVGYGVYLGRGEG